MSIYKLLLGLGATSMIVLPFTTVSCSRYSVKDHDDIVAVLKKLSKNSIYLANVKLPAEIKIPNVPQPLKMSYDKKYLAGSINWSTKIGDTTYYDTLAGWKQYPTLDLHNPNNKQDPTKWGDSTRITVLGQITTQLQLVLLGNGYTVQQNINIDGLKSLSKNTVSSAFTGLFQDILDNKQINQWVTKNNNPNTPLSSIQKEAINNAKSKIVPSLPKNPTIDKWFPQSNVNSIMGMFSITNKSTIGVNSTFFNFSKIPYKSNIKDRQQFLINWAISDKTDLENIFASFTNFEFKDFINSISDTQ